VAYDQIPPFLLPIVLLLALAIAAFLPERVRPLRNGMIFLLAALTLFHAGRWFHGAVWDSERGGLRVGRDFFHYYLGAKYPELGYVDFYENISRAAATIGIQDIEPQDLRFAAEIDDPRSNHYLLLISRYLLPLDRAKVIDPGRRETFWLEYFDPKKNRKLKKEYPEVIEVLRKALPGLPRFEGALFAVPKSPEDEAWVRFADRAARLFGTGVVRLRESKETAKLRAFLDEMPPRSSTIAGQVETLCRDLSKLSTLLPATERRVPEWKNTVPRPAQPVPAASPETELAADLKFMVSHGLDLRVAVRDHGFNGTPFWTSVQKLNPLLRGPLTSAKLAVLISLDWLLLLGVLALIQRIFRLDRWSFFAVASWFFLQEAQLWLSFQSSLLRFDWLFAFAAGFFFLVRGHPWLSGFGFAYAILVRIFPAIPLFGIAATWFSKRSGNDDVSLRHVPKMLASTVIFLGIGFLLGAAVGGWGPWWEKISSQFLSGYSPSNNVSLQFSWSYLVYRFRLFGPWENETAFATSKLTLGMWWVMIIAWWFCFRRREIGRQLALWLTALPLLLRDVLNYYCLGNLFAGGDLLRLKRWRTFGCVSLLSAASYLAYEDPKGLNPFLLGLPYALIAFVYLGVLMVKGE
jgi:hypothetical protein